MVVINERQRETLKIAVLGGDVTREDVRCRLQIGGSSAWSLLNKLTKEGLLQKMGEGHRTRYVATKKGCDIYHTN